MKIMKNARYYKYIGKSDQIVELRVLDVIDDNTCKCKITKGINVGSLLKIPITTLKSEYTYLIPDGFITFSIAQIQKGLEDVMVTLLPRENTGSEFVVPSVVCRQCVVDLFVKQINPTKDFVGLSISRETCPADVEFVNFLACESISDSEYCSYYIGDKLEDILTLFDHSKYDKVLSKLLSDHCNSIKQANPTLGEFLSKKEEIDGYVNNLNDLLKLNNFEYDLYRAFNIIPTKLSKEEFSEGVLSINAMNVLSNILRTKIYKSLVVKYEKDIDLKSIAKRYVLVADNEGTVYVVAYFVNKSYYTESENLTDKVNPETARNGYENIKFDSGKYKK